MRKNSKQDWLAGGALIACICLAIVGVAGWVMNIVALTQSSFEPITGMLVARIIGVFLAPLGAVLGYL